MNQAYAFWGVSVVVLGSAVWDLLSGRTRLRGIGTYHRRERPGAYWGAIALKAFLVLVLGGIGFAVRRW